MVALLVAWVHLSQRGQGVKPHHWLLGFFATVIVFAACATDPTDVQVAKGTPAKIQSYEYLCSEGYYDYCEMSADTLPTSRALTDSERAIVNGAIDAIVNEDNTECMDIKDALTSMVANGLIQMAVDNTLQDYYAQMGGGDAGDIYDNTMVLEAAASSTGRDLAHTLVHEVIHIYEDLGPDWNIMGSTQVGTYIDGVADGCLNEELRAHSLVSQLHKIGGGR
jgi:hypothetical protein